MNSPAEAPVLCLGVDGGGTKTAAWLGRVRGGQLEVIGRGRGGAGNLQSLGFDHTTGSITSSIERAFEAAVIPRQPVRSACLCLAGAGRPAEQARIHDWAIQSGICETCQCVGDAEVIFAADDSRIGQSPLATIALIVGTGSIAWGKGFDGRMARCGGWGYLLGDEGSGYALAVAALRLACRTADGRCGETGLLDAILKSTGCAQAHELIPWAYCPAASREQVARLSSVVFQQAESSVLLREIIDDGARALSAMIIATTKSLETDAFELLITGGVACHQPSYVERIKEFLVAANHPPTSTRVIEHPVLGALRLAALRASTARTAVGLQRLDEYPATE